MTDEHATRPGMPTLAARLRGPIYDRPVMLRTLREVADRVEALEREAALLSEYVALLEWTTNKLTACAHVNGMTPPPRDVDDEKRLRAAIAEVRGGADG